MSMSTNNDVYANTEARKAIRSRLAAAHSLLVNYGAYEDAMNSLDWNEKPTTRVLLTRSAHSSTSCPPTTAPPPTWTCN